MRQLLFLGIALSLAIPAIAAKNSCEYSIKPDSVKVGWTAYKFTEKTPVKGELKNIQVAAVKSASVKDLLQSASFVIDPSSVESGDPARDFNIRNHFFKWLKVPHIKGYVESFDSKKAQVHLSLNGESRSIEFKVKKNGKIYQGEAEIDVLDFAMKKSFDDIHKTCHELHKGVDGVAKTWSTVGLSITAEVSEDCNKK